jgi:hypothetical protein
MARKSLRAAVVRQTRWRANKRLARMGRANGCRTGLARRNRRTALPRQTRKGRGRRARRSCFAE